MAADTLVLLETTRVHRPESEMNDYQTQRAIDLEHLKLLRWGYLVTGAITCIYALFPLMYVVFGVVLTAAAVADGTDDVPVAVGIGIAAIGIIVSMAIAAVGILKLLAAKAIRQRRSRGLCYFAAVVSCLNIPLGTIVGICTFMVLARPGVEELFRLSEASVQVTQQPPRPRSLFDSDDPIAQDQHQAFTGSPNDSRSG
jgi:hypothetical protein